MDPKDPKQLSAEEIKAIGEIEVGPSKHEVFLNNHYKKLLAGLVVVALGGAAVIGYYSYDTQKEETAANTMMDALQIKSIDAAPTAASYKRDAIDSVSSGTRASQSAALLAAMIDLNANKTDVAIPALEQLSQTAADLTIRARAAALVANYYTKEGDAKAVDAWKKLVMMEDNLYKGFALLSLGDLAKLAGDKDAARQYYTQAEQTAQTSTFVQSKDIELRRRLLDVDDPKPVVPAAPAATEGESMFNIPSTTLPDASTMPAETPALPTTL